MMATGRAVQALVTQVSVSSILFREPQLCCSFLAKCSLYTSLQPCSFPSEESKVAFVVTLLTGRAASWGTTVWEQRFPCCTSFQSFSDELNKVFDRAASGREVARLLAELSQGDCTVTEYSTEFHTLAAECGWNDEAQWDMFLYGLSDLVKDEICSLELPAGRHYGGCHSLLWGISLPLGRWVSFFQIPYRWVGPVFCSRRSRDAERGDYACIVELPVTLLGIAW